MDDKDLVAGLLREDPAAQNQLDQAYRKRLYQTAVYFLGAQDAEVEDVVQESFVMALRDLKGFEFRASLYTWLNHICVNRCFQRIRNRQRSVLGLEESFDAMLASKAQSQASSEAEAALKAERQGLLRRALGQMNELCRSVISLRIDQELSYAEIAKSLRVPMGTVMSRLARCQGQLNALVSKLQATYD